jgi:nitronate monooxygenase
LRYPIVQAPTNGPAGPELATAIADAGALGAIPLTWTAPDAALALVQQVRAATKGTFFANFVLAVDPPFDPRSFDNALEAGTPVVQFSWGIPSAEHVRKVRAAHAKFGVQVTSAGSARAALDAGADYLVCQGIEAGGHVQATRPLMEQLVEVLDEVRRVRAGVPVLASGGISTGRDIRRAMARGAAGAVLGTRFVATLESRAHPEYKRALLAANGHDTVYTTCLSKGWPNAPHRILRNPTFTMWEAAGCPPAGRRPGETDVVARDGDTSFERYRTRAPLASMTGAVMEMGTYAGMGVGSVRDLPAAGDLVRRLWREFQQGKA